MEPGRKLDALMARRLWKAVVMYEGGEPFLVGAPKREQVPLPHYSTDIEDNQRVVARLQRDGWTLKLDHDPKARTFRATFYKDDTPGRYRFSDGRSAAHAVCLAALDAMAGTNRA